MDEYIKTYLYDMLNAIIEIESFFADPSIMTEVYRNDLRTRRAVERNFTILGEAMNRILKIDSNFHLSNSRGIVDFRNKIIHGYDVITGDMVCDTITNDLPVLKRELEILLNE